MSTWSTSKVPVESISLSIMYPILVILAFQMSPRAHLIRNRKLGGFCHSGLLILIKSLFVQPVLPASHPVRTIPAEFSYDIYDPILGPYGWPEECNTGRYQSPIDIPYSDTSTNRGEITKLWLSPTYYQNHHGFFSTNTGKTFQVQFSPNGTNPTSNKILSGAALSDSYVFAQLHFHWGERDEVGSEHTLQGQRYPMEMHMVHYKSIYGNLSNALRENDPESVAVLSVLFQLGDENPALRPILKAARLSPYVSDESHLKYFSRLKLNLKRLLPPQLDFVRYLGSLTTPPCSERVSWTVFLTPNTISLEQLEVLRRLRNHFNERYYNYRPLMPRNGRQIRQFKVLGLAGGISPLTTIKSTLFSAFRDVGSTISGFFYNFRRSFV